MKRKIDHEKMVHELIEAGELIAKGYDFFEDMGGHIVHESDVASYFNYYVERMTPAERRELTKRLTEDI